MCGICGIVALDGVLDPGLRDVVRSMTNELRHRGPESEGFFNDDIASLGHRRLAIIDREHGAQPISNEDGSIWVIFNGEIFRHRSLRQDLEKRGHVFQTSSDTECIVHAYEEYGTDCVSRLDGMFAFAVYDRVKRELFLARDRLGKKPLVYAILGGAFHFASEIKALYRSPYWDPSLDLTTLEGYLSLGYFVAPSTPYRHVQKLEPAHWLRIRDGQVTTRKYWDIERFDDYEGDSATLREDVESAVRDSVRMRLESEVPLGAFLSGGIDSGLIVSFMAETLGAGIVTTSVGFEDTNHNELAAAELTARRYHTSHHSSVVEPRLEEVLDPIVHAFDEPFADSSAIPTYYVSAMARRHVTVALTGDGGDEAFGGYSSRYIPHALESVVRPHLASSVRGGSAWLGEQWPRASAVPRLLRWGTFLENVGRDPAGAYYADLCFAKPRQTHALLGLDAGRRLADSPVYDVVTTPYRQCSSKDPVQRAQFADLKIYLSNDVLVKVDRMSMLHSLEVRSPLLDHRVVELAFRIPRTQKLPLLRPKHILRQIARNRLPKQVVRLPKRGFSAPVGAWITGAYSDMFRSEVLAPSSMCSGLLDIEYVRQLFERHRRGQIDYSFLLWAIWLLERWHMLGKETWRRELRPAPMPEVILQPRLEAQAGDLSNGGSDTAGDGIRVAFVLHVMQVAGAEVLVSEIIQRLGYRIRPVIFCLDSIGALGQHLRRHGVEVVCLDRRPGVDFGVAQRMATEIRRRRIDIVHAHQYTPFFYAAFARALCGGKPRLIFTEHGRHYPDIVSTRRRLTNGLVLNRLVNEVTAVCAFSARSLSLQDGFTGRQIRVIENGIDLARYSGEKDRITARRSVGLDPARRYVANIARFHPVKDQVTLLRAFAEIARQYQNVDLLLVGDGPLRSPLEQLAGSLAINGRVRFLGVRHDVPDILQAVDVFVLTSVSEAASITLLEAMASRVPVVVTAVGGNPEMVHHNVEGLLVPRGDPQATAIAIAQLLDDPEKAAAMGAAGMRRVHERYRLGSTIESYYNLYCELSRRFTSPPSHAKNSEPKIDTPTSVTSA